MDRSLTLPLMVLIFIVQQTCAQVCPVNQCSNGENCFTRNSVEGYVCECNLPFRDGYNCEIGPDNQEVFTCYGTDCSTGVFQSVNYPSAYPNRYRALYLLYIPGANGITFTFDPVFGIETDKDELYVGKGLSVDFTALNGVNTVGPDVVFFEGFTQPAGFTISDTDTVWMYFITDKNLEYSGFSIRWQMVDNIPPTITGCPSNIVQTSPGNTPVQVTWIPPTATDASEITTAASHFPGASFPVGSTTVTYTFTDAFGNTNTCSFTVTIVFVDNTPPVITGCPSNIVLTSTTTAGTQAFWTEPTATDVSQVTTSSTHTPGATFPIGTTTVTYTFTDAFNNFDTCSFDVTVQFVDAIPPTIFNCPQSFTTTAPFGATSIPVSWTEPTATDNVGTPTLVVQTQTSGSSFTVGQTTTVLYRWTDAAGNSADCTFDVTVVGLTDTTAPVVTFCPDDITTFVPFLSAGTTVTWTEPTATDNSGSVQTTQSHTSGSFFAAGSSTEVTYIFRDAAGNEAICTFNVRVFQQSDTEAPVVSVCPDNIAVSVPFLSTGTTVSWNEPTVTDNSGAFTTTQTHDSGSFFAANTQTQVTYTFTDAANNQAFCIFTVTVTSLGDNVPPVITSCPSDITTVVPFLSAGDTVSWTEPVVSDNSGNFDTLQTHASGTFFPVGDTQVTYTFRDAANNEAICTFTVRVLQQGDTEAPVVSVCPESISIAVPFQSTGTTVSWNEPTVTDNSGAFTTTQTHNSGSFFAANTQTQVTYTFTDAANNQAFCIFTVTVTSLGDNVPPVITSCPSDITAVVPFLSAGDTVSWTEPVVSDNSGNFDTLQTHASGTFFPVGDTQVTYTFRDAANNEAICTFTVRVLQQGDTEAPVISVCPESISITVPFQSTGTTVSWNEPTVTDNSGAFTTTQTHNSGSFFAANTQTQVTYTFTDAANNQAFCIFTVTVTGLGDTVPPVITSCPSDITTVVPFLSAGDTVSWTEPVVSDNSGNFDTLQTHASGTFFPVGDTQVTYTFRDAANNEAICTFTVRVLEQGDTEAPVVSVCPESISITVPFQSTGTTVSWNEPTVTDNSGAFTTTQTHDSGSFFAANTQTQVTYTFTDAANNQAFCIFTVTVIELGDTVPPVVTFCPDDITTFVPFLSTGTTVTWTEPTVVDNSGAVDTAQTHTSGSFFAIGETQVTYTFRDTANNEATCQFIVRVIEQGDTEAPVVSFCPDNIALSVPFLSTGTSVSWNEPTVTDNSGAFTTTQTHDSGSFFAANTQTQVTYTFTDAANNQAFCIFTVTVTSLGDTVPPVITSCPSDITTVVPFLSAGDTVSWTEPVVSDNSGNFDTLQTHASGTFFPVGDTQVTYTFRDAANNEAICTFTVRVLQQGDTEAPVVSVCPESISITVPFQSTGTTVSWNEPTVTDNSGAFTTTQTHDSGSFFAANTQTQVTYTFTDAANNQAFCIFTVTVVELGDTVPPVVTFCPDDITTFVPFLSTGTTVTWTEPTVVDNSGAVDTAQTHTSGSFFAIGETQVTYTFRDAANNEATCQFIVRVIEQGDTEAPVVSFCPDNIALSVPFLSTGTSVSWNEPTVTDNSGAFTTTQTHDSGSFFAANTQTQVTYTFTDAANNQAFCIFTVTVTEQGDTVPPVITSCPSDITVVVPFLSAGDTVSWTEPVVSDNSGNFDTLQTHASGTFFPVGDTQVTYTFRDAANNEAVCTFVVRVIQLGDTEAPVVSICPESISITVPFQSTGTTVSWNEPTVTDNSGAFTTTQTHDSGSFFAANTQTQVTYTFTDAANNQAFCIFTVTVTELGDSVPPVVTFCPDDITNFVPFLSTGTTVTWTEPTVVDNSGSVDTAQTHSSGSFFAIGETPVTYTFRDAANNEARCTFTVRVIELGDTTAPDVTICPNNIEVSVPFLSTGTTVSWNEPVATDNSGAFTTTQTHDSGSFFAANTQTQVTYTFTDAANNQAFCIFTVTVTELGDNTPPVVAICPNDITEFVPFLTSGTVVNWVEPDVTDNSGSFSTAQNRASGSFFVTGSETVVTYTFTDAAGNEAICAFTVRVIELGDVTPPVVTQCPSDISTSVPFQSTGTTITWAEPVATDNSGAFTTTQTHDSGSFFAANTQTQVTYTFTDAANNQAFCVFTVTVTELGDGTPPQVTCPPNINEVVQFGAGGAVLTWELPTVTDNSGSFTLVENSHNSGDFIQTGQTVVTYRYADAAGNDMSCSFVINIVEVDSIPPVLQTCPSNIVEQVQLGVTGTTVTWQVPTATDNSGQQVVIAQNNFNPGAFFPLGDTVVTYVLMDPSGNEVTCQFTITVIAVDTLPPTLVTCPEDITQTIITGTGPIAVNFVTPTATDNSGVVNLVFNSHSPGDQFSAGTTEVTYLFEDEAGLSVSCVFTVTINEVNPCLSQPCLNGAVCIPESLNSYRCLCTSCFTGDRCEQAVDACDANLCQNGAICQALSGSCTQYECQCPSCFIGQFCERNVDSCENNQCANGAVCVTSPDNCIEYTCQCPPCFTGRFCDIPIGACDSHDCQNGAVCVPGVSSANTAFSCSEFTCSCSGCFTGEKCEIQRDACNPNPCLNNGLCTTLPDSCYTYSCQCVGCFTGYNCELAISSPCANNPCQNGGVCSVVDGTCSAYVCSCPNTHIGVNCETPVTVNENPCNSFPCENGASCLTMDGSYYICLCTSGFVGQNCQTPRANIPAMDSCDTTPCQNGGTCYNSYNSNSGSNLIPQYTCVCNNGFTGSNCVVPVADNPSLDICSLDDTPNCEQGAACNNAFHSFDNDVDYVCACPVGFIGHNCETISTNPCNSNPCKNGAQCVPTNTYFTCQCPAGYGGSTCEIPVGDNVDPVIEGCPQSITMNIGAGSSTVVTWTAPTATDNSGTAFLVFASSSPGSSFPVGTTAVSYVYSDNSMNYAICTFYVTVTTTVADNIPPVISNCPSNIAVTAAVGASSAVVTWVEPTATDNSGVAVTRVSTALPGTSFPLGQTTVTYTFTDNSGNNNVCSFVVTVNSATPGDNVAPVISNCPMSASATLAEGATSVAVTWTVPTATDNSGGVVTRISTHNPGDLFNAGITNVIYTFTDPSGNQATCEFVVMVNEFTGSDTEAPVISGCPTSRTVAPDPGTNAATVSWIEPTAVDNSGQEPGVAKSHTPPATFPANTITRVTYVFYDNVGNFDTCDFTVTVSTSIPGTDTTPPVISNCPNGVAASGDGSAVVSWVEPTAVDNDGQVVTVSRSHVPNTVFPVGTTTVNYIFTDSSGNPAFCSFVVTVTQATGDTTPPVISNCPSNIAVTAAVGASSAVVTWVEPTATDNSGIAVTRVSNVSPGTSFPIGQTTVTYTFTDNSGNNNVCSFVVTVNSATPVDNIDPVISNCPMSASATLAQGATSVAVTWTVPTATDNSGGVVTRISTHNPGDLFNAGITNVIYTFTDPSGNQATCEFVVMVNDFAGGDTEAPLIFGCPTSRTVAPDTGSNSATVSWVEPTATDNSGQTPGVTSSHSPPATFPANTITRVVYTFFDNSGNFDTCIFTVTVTAGGSAGDNTAPVVSNCPNGVAASGDGNAVVSWVEPTAVDNDGQPVTVTQSHTPSSVFNVGSTRVTYRFTDTSGNEAVCSFLVTVTGITDNTPPVISNCPSNIAVTAAAGATSAVVTWTEPTATDNSGDAVTRVSTASPGTSFNVGQTTVTYTFTDNSGNAVDCSFVVTVTASVVTTNPCNSNPCPASQNCYYRENEYLCLDMRRRRDVQEDNECKCKNGGMCTGDKDSGVSCACPEGYTGMLCEKALAAVSVCEPNPCANNGTCIELMSSTSKFAYKCVCNPGWEGYHCKRSVFMPESKHDLADTYSSWSTQLQLMVGCTVAILGTIVIILAATICRLAPRRFTGTQKFHVDEATLIQ